MPDDAIRRAVQSAEPFDPSADPAELARLLMDERRNDTGNASRLIARHGHDLLYVGGQGWHAWDGRRWAPDPEAQEIRKRAHRVARAIEEEAEEKRQAMAEHCHAHGVPMKAADEEATRLARWSVASGNLARLNGMISEARPYLQAAVAEMDAEAYLVNARNGTLRLDAPFGEGGDGDGGGGIELVPFDRSHRLTRMLGAVYDPAAPCPNFERFMQDILPEAETRLFVQRYLGSCLTGAISDQVVLMMLGQGANGKSTLVNVMARVFSELSLSLPFASLQHNDRRRGGEASPDIAMLPGRRLVTASEPDTGVRLSESTIKTLSGGEEVPARNLHEGFFHFRPQAKLVMSFNNQPSIRGQDEGIWRRIALVRFEVIIPPERRDPRYVTGEIFDDELSGILNWLLDGLRTWRERGLAMPASVRAATTGYRTSEDRLGPFVDSCCRRTAGARCRAQELYAAYARWCRANAADPLSQTLFGKLMSERGFRREKVGFVYYADLEIVDDMHDAAEAEGGDHG